MRFLFDPLKEQEQKLERFRQSFRLLVSDGHYPHDRQQRLFQAARKAGLDWDAARRHILPDALAFLQSVVDRMVADAKLTAAEVAELRRLQRRLLVGNDQAAPVLERVYDLVERRLAGAIIDYAAYLGEPEVIAQLRQDITAYDLPAERSRRLLAQIDRQHDLSTMMIGNLPVVRASVSLRRDEACHYDSAVTVLTSGEHGDLLEGRLVISSQRLLVLAPNGGVQAEWAECRAVELVNRSLVLVTSSQTAMILCDDPQYVATLIAAARRRYVPQAASQPLRGNKRLSLS